MESETKPKSLFTQSLDDIMEGHKTTIHAIGFRFIQSDVASLIGNPNKIHKLNDIFFGG